MNKGKMTLEEFQQILDDAEISTDFESILNKLTGYFYRLLDESIADGYESLSKMYMIKGNRIYNALDQRGYYDNERRLSDDIR